MIKQHKNKYPLTFEVRKDIDALIVGMPNIPMVNAIGKTKKNKVVKLDSAVFTPPKKEFNKDLKIITESGNVTNEFTIYEKTEFINHKVNLHQAYQKFGKQGISDYLRFIESCKIQIVKNELHNTSTVSPNSFMRFIAYIRNLFSNFRTGLRLRSKS